MSSVRRKATETGEEEKEGKKKKIGWIRDPRSLPASSLDLDTFGIQFPFIEVDFVENLQGKFSRDAFMDIDALECFVNHIFLTLEANTGVWYGTEGNSMGGELATRPIHLIFFGCLCKLSKAYLDFKGKKKLEEEDIVPAHLHVRDTLDLQPSSGQDSPSTGSSTEGSICNHEGKAGTGIPDIMIKTFCKSFLREKNHKPTDPRTVKTALARRKLRTIAIIELKQDVQASDRGLYQCASYAISEAMTNIKLYKDKPIYLLLSSNTQWYIGTLTMRSIVRVGDDGLVKNDPCEDKDALDARLHERLERLECFSSGREMSNEPGRYPVGEMCICSEIFKRSLSYETVTPHDFFLVQCLLRLMLGDSILEINVEDAQEIIKICEEEEKKKISERIAENSADKKTDAETWRRREKRNLSQPNFQRSQ